MKITEWIWTVTNCSGCVHAKCADDDEACAYFAEHRDETQELNITCPMRYEEQK